LPVADPDILELIENVRNVRRTLDTDLTTTAAALDEGRTDIARDIIDGSLADVAAFRAAAIERLKAEDAAVPSPPTRSRPVHSGSRRLQSRRARALVAIPAIPLAGALAMGAAAAIGHLSTPTNHHDHASAATTITRPVAHPSATPKAATTTLARLERVVSHHPQSSQVLAVANDLHKQLTHIITTASHNPNRLGVVTRLLNDEQRVLKTTHAPGTSIALAASRQVRQLLQQTTTPVLSLTNPTPAPHATATKTMKTTSKNSHHSTSTSSTHHKRSTHPKRKTHTSTPTPTPSDPIFSKGVLGVIS
jgi:hypothetical protein